MRVKESRRYQPELDGLRAVAVLLVLASHFGLGAGGGYVGVTLFFVLSGYLITGILLDELDRTGSIALGRFYARRGARLLPALAIVLAAVCVWAFLTQTLAAAAPGVVGAALYFGNWMTAAGVDARSLEHTWSLGIEEQFYLVWPLALLLVRRRKALIAVAAGGAVAAVVLRGISGTSIPDLWWAYHATTTRADALLLGSLVSMVSPRPGRVLRLAAVATLTFLVVAGLDPDVEVRFGLTAVALAAVVVVSFPLPLTAPPLVAIGRISYGLYLWHYPLLAVLGPVGIAVAFPVAWASHRWVEEPVRDWARRAPGRHPAEAVPASA